MRLLLDAHISGPRVGRRLEERGDTMCALSTRTRRSRGSTAREVLALASEEQRILVTHNIRDFPGIVREWASAQRSHAGVILVYGIDHSELDLIVSGIERWRELHPESARRIDLAAVLDRDFASG